MVCMMRTHSNPSSDAMNMALVVSEDDGYTWSPPKRTNIWGYPAELSYLPDGRVLMVYGYRRPPYGERGCISDDGVTGTSRTSSSSARAECPVQALQRRSIALLDKSPASTGTTREFFSTWVTRRSLC